LLSNDGTLPLEKTLKTLAVIGPNANSSRNLLGDYSYAAVAELLSHTQPPDSCFYKADTSFINHGQINIPTILDAIRAKVPNTKVLYAKGCDIHSPSRDGFHEALKAAERADIVVLVLGDKSGLTPDCTCGEFRDNADLKLPGVQSELAQAVFSLNKPTVVVLINGRPLAIPDIAEKASAIIEAWLPGEEGGVAIADALFGDVNPGGKVPMSFPRSVGQVPLFYNHKPAGGKSYLYNDYVAESTQPLYPFGHGLSYTSFDYKNLSIEPKQAVSGRICLY
jgi:beta-glucosidase